MKRVPCVSVYPVPPPQNHTASVSKISARKFLGTSGCAPDFLLSEPVFLTAQSVGV